MKERENYGLLRVLGSGAVVLLHICAKVINNYQLSDKSSVFLALAISSLTRWVVPLFVMISGAIFLGKSYEWNGGRFFLKKRLARVLPVLFFWNIVYFVVFNRGSWVAGVETFLRYSQTYYHLYYLVVALGLYAVTPFLRRRRWWRLVWAPALMVSLIYILGYYFLWWPKFDWPIAIFVPYLGYYLLGGLLEKLSLPKRFLVLAVILAVAMFGVNSRTLFWYGAGDRGQFAFDRLWPWVGGQAVIVFLTMKGLGQGRFGQLIFRLGEVSLGVYLVHPLITDLVLRQETNFIGISFTFWWIISRWLVAWVVSVLVVLALKKIPLIRVAVGG